MTDDKLLNLRSNNWNVLTLWKKKNSASLKNVINKMCLQIIYLIYTIYPTPLLGQDMTQGQFFKRSLTDFEFRVFLLLD